MLEIEQMGLAFTGKGLLVKLDSHSRADDTTWGRGVLFRSVAS
jgi:hypothetical protein